MGGAKLLLDLRLLACVKPMEDVGIIPTVAGTSSESRIDAAPKLGVRDNRDEVRVIAAAEVAGRSGLVQARITGREVETFHGILPGTLLPLGAVTVWLLLLSGFDMRHPNGVET